MRPTELPTTGRQEYPRHPKEPVEKRVVARQKREMWILSYRSPRDGWDRGTGFGRSSLNVNAADSKKEIAMGDKRVDSSRLKARLFVPHDTLRLEMEARQVQMGQPSVRDKR